MARTPKIIRRFNAARWESQVYRRTRRWLIRYFAQEPTHE